MTSDKYKIVLNYCSYCRTKYSKDLIKKIKHREQPLFCELCHTRIKDELSNKLNILVENKDKDELSRKNKQKSVSEPSSHKDNNIEQLKLFISRRIYELFKSPKYSVKLDKRSNELAIDQLNDIAKTLRKMLIYQSIPEYWFKELSNVNLYDFMKCYEKFHKIVKNKKTFREIYLEFFRDTIQFIHRLKNGTVRASDIQGFQEQILKDMKRCYGFIRNALVEGSFEWHLTFFLAVEIYKTIRSSKLSSELMRDQKVIKNSFMNRLALIAIKSLKNKQLCKNWISRFKSSNKVEYFRKLESFLFELNSDHIYRQSFLEFLHWLIKIVFGLINGSNNSSNPHRIKKCIEEHLIRVKPFDNDPNLPSHFKSNLIMLLSRFIYLKIKYQENFLNLQANQMKLTKSLINNEVNDLIENLMSNKRLKYELLGNLYKISQTEFQEGYIKFRSNLKFDRIYRIYFAMYLGWLIKTVFKLNSEKVDISKLSKTEQIILSNLENFQINEEIFNKKENNQEKDKHIVEIKNDNEVNINKDESKIAKSEDISEFDEEYIIKLFEFVKFVFNSLNITNQKSLKSLNLKTKQLFNDALEKGLTRKIVHMQDLRYPEKFAVVLAYYALKLNYLNKINRSFLKPAYIYDMVKESLRERGISISQKRPTLLSGFFYEYLSNENQEKLSRLTEFKSKLSKGKEKQKILSMSIKNEIKSISDRFDKPKDLFNTSSSILKDLDSNKFEIINLPSYCRSARNIARIVVFLALQHEDYTTTHNYSNFETYFNCFPNYSKTMKSTFFSSIPILYRFLSNQIKMKIEYLPRDFKNSIDHSVLENHLWKYFDKIMIILSLTNKEVLKSTASELYKNALSNGFSYPEIPTSIQHLSVALLFFSIQASKEHSKLSRASLLKKLNNAGFNIDEHSMGPTLKYLDKLIEHDVDLKFKAKINSNYFENQLTAISLDHKSFGRDRSHYFANMILELFRMSQLTPQDFAIKLGIFGSDPSQILGGLNSKGLLTKVDVFLEIVEKIKTFILFYIPIKERKRFHIKLSKLIEYFELSKRLVKYESYLRRKEREKKYGENYRSTPTRIKRFIVMLGFSPYDGYDLIENKFQSQGKIRLNAHFHHIDYNSDNDKEENLIFIPSKHPKDAGTKINYMTHDIISGLESLIKDERKSDKQKELALNKLLEIKNKLETNESIISSVFYSKNEQLLNGLVGWSPESINKIKNRLKDVDLEWCIKLNEYIPKEKYGKQITDDAYDEILKNISMSCKKT